MTESVHKDVSPSVEGQNPIIDKKTSKWESVLLYLVVFAPLLPGAWQSISVGLLGIGFLVRRGWRSNVWSSDIGTLFRRTLSILAVVWVLLLVLGCIDWARSGDLKSLSLYIRQAGKQGIWGAIAISSMLFFQFNRARSFLNSRILLAFVASIFIYGLLQRYTGVDWVHGLSAKLGEHRYAYGVYRVSGWMDHPLTFSFNLMLMSLLSFAQSLAQAQRGDKPEAWRYAAITILLFATLLLTDSRFPIILTTILLGIGLVWQIPKIRVPVISVSLIVLLTGVALLPKMAPETIGRWGELVDSKVPWEQRFDRVIFWKINWELAAESPWLGTGLKGYEPRLLDTYERAGYTNLERKYNAHNIYLQTLADTGALGCLALVGLLFALGRLAVRTKRDFQHIALPLIFAATLGSGLVQNNLRDSEFLFALWISTGICLSWLIVQGKPDGRGNEPKLEDLKS